MGIELKSYKAAKEYFTRAMKTCEINEIILIHNQRDTVRKLLKETAEENNRTLIEKDLSTVTDTEIAGIETDNKVPEWMKPCMKSCDEKRFVLFLREFHQASPKVKDDVLNTLIKKEVQDFKLPKHTLIVVGIIDQDDEAEALGHTHTVRFFK